MPKQYRTGKLTKPFQKDKQVEITFHEHDEYSPDNVETTTDEELQAITNQLENFKIGDFVYAELKDKTKIEKARSNHFAGQIINLDDNEAEISSLKHSEKYFW